MASGINVHVLAELSAEARLRLLKRTEADLSEYMAGAQAIIEEVRRDGDRALVRLARHLDKSPVDIGRLAARHQDFEAAERGLDPDVRGAMEYAAEAIRRFHERQLPPEMWMTEIRPGVFAGDRHRPIPSVACYVPRGKGAFPSVALMTTLPAKVAGVPRIAILTPPGPDGHVDAATLVAARMAGVEAVYKAGGAQAVAAAAYGTQTVPRFDKLVGPGSPWVTAAKWLVSGILDTGTPAGPSEIIVLADDTVDGRLAALDVLIEAEHGADSSAYIVTWSRRVAEQARTAIVDYARELGSQRGAFVAAVLGGPAGGIVLARDAKEAIAFVNDYAPEHLEILSREPYAYLGRIEHAGEILLGERTPATLANFVIGPNHVLPTGGWAKTGSALSVHDFLKRTSIAHVTEGAYADLARHAHVLACYEGFEAHANAVSQRREAILKA
jgi:histidinol dehydrogenase